MTRATYRRAGFYGGPSVSNSVETFHSLSQLEGEMKRAENAFVDADAIFQKADSAFKEAERRYTVARRERDTALSALNECHLDIDRTIGMLREMSPAGCDWRNEADSSTGVAAIPADDTLTFMLKD